MYGLNLDKFVVSILLLLVDSLLLLLLLFMVFKSGCWVCESVSDGGIEFAAASMAAA